MSAKEQLISQIESVLNQINDTVDSGFSSNPNFHDIYFREGYIYSLKKWKNKIESIEYDTIIETQREIEYEINRTMNTLSGKGETGHPRAKEGRQEASKVVLQLLSIPYNRKL